MLKELELSLLSDHSLKYKKIEDTSVGLINGDPTNWVINYSTINLLLLNNDINQNLNYDLLSTKKQFGDKTRCLKKMYFIEN